MLTYKVHRCGREVCYGNAAGKREYRSRTLQMRDRQGELCLWCGFWMAIDETSFDHFNGRGAGKQDDRIIINGKPVNAALHIICNGERGSRRVPYPHAYLVKMA